MNKLISLPSMALVAFTIVAISAASAAPPIGTAKARGDYSSTFWGSSGGRSIRHARDYSRGYRTYARQAPTIAPQIAQHEAAGVGHNITQAKQQFAEVRKATTDKETLASLDAIDKQLAAAAKAHAQMHEMCHMETVDADGTMKCCQEVDAALAKAIAEHDKLMQRLEGEPAAAAPQQ